MFTGIVEGTGLVRAVERHESGFHLGVEAPFLEGGIREGDSLAVNGCCLTATRVEGGTVVFDLLEETLRVTNLGDLRAGAGVNLERAVAAGGRMGGHFVTGHIDCTVPVIAFGPSGPDYRLELGLPEEFAHYAVHKGSLAVDGISLTIAEVCPGSVVLWIIPHTRAVTNLAARVVGERVNVEFDLLAKYVERVLAARA